MKKQKKNLEQYMAAGGTATNLAQAGFNVMDQIIGLFENDPRAYSEQPIYNASTMRNMVTPYASGGTIHIKKENRGKFTAAAKKAGMGVQAYAKKVLANPNASATLKKRANFARNAAKWHHAFGGEIGTVPAEVEDQEILETPDGQIFQAQGATHEEGGIQIEAPVGTNVYSDRLQIDGKTMQERKAHREKKLNKLSKLFDKSPSDQLLKNTLQRTQEQFDIEDTQDVAIQNAVNYITSPDKFALGGTTGGDPVLDFIVSMLGGPLQKQQQAIDAFGKAPKVLSKDSTYVTDITNDAGKVSTANTPKPSTDEGQGTDAGKLTVGDYLGLAGNAFNAIAPIVNTINNATNRKPNVNRFLGFGKDALRTNQKAQDVVAGLRSSALTDIDTATNTALSSNRNSAQGISTLRALDAITNLNKTKAQVAANNSYAGQLAGLLGQESELENMRDRVVMAGESQRDVEDKADYDNYYSNMAENLVNFGVNIQGMGKNLNTAHANEVDSNLLSQLSQYGLGFDKKGNLIKVR